MDKDKKKEQLSVEVIKVALAMKETGLTPGHTGNVSARFEDGMLITPTGMAYEALEPDDIVYVSHEGDWDSQGRVPSSEWQFHLSAYQAAKKANKNVKALVHTHSNYATTLACARLEIPPFHYMVAVGGSDRIPLVPYAIFGSQELSGYVAGAFASYKACLMAHHGLLAGEASLTKALEAAEIIEDLAHQYWAVRQLGEVKLLSDQQMEEVIEKFKTYGQQKDRG